MDFPDIPDRIITAADVRLWRFMADDFGADLRVPVDMALPIFGPGQQWVGAATYGFYRVYGVCGADCPERLNFENGESVYLVPLLASDAYTEDGGPPLVVGFRFAATPGDYGRPIERDVF